MSLCSKCGLRPRIRPGDPCRVCRKESRGSAGSPLGQMRKAKAEQERRAHERLIMSELERENESLREQVKFLGRMQNRPPEILVYKQAKRQRSDSIACAIASDWHVEETVRKDSVHGLNEYNLDVAKSRAEHFFRNYLRLTDIAAKESSINTLFLFLGGDFFSGWIHKELLAANSLAPGDAARFCLGLFFSGFDFLLRESSYVLEVVAIPGNHGRLTEQVHHSDPTGTSLESFMYHALAARYDGNHRVKIQVADKAMVYRKLYENFTVRMLHGYEIKYGGGVGGITIPVNKAIAQWDKAVRADLTLFGHFHQLIDGGRFLGNGSLIGYNTYAQAIKAEYEEPKQAFFAVHARRGGCRSLTAPIWLDDSHKASK
jgi:hypothetical protein